VTDARAGHELFIQSQPNVEQVMSQELDKRNSGKLVLVVGLDLSDVSEHLLSHARLLLRSAQQGDLYMVHVVPRESFAERISHPLPSPSASERSGTEASEFELKRLGAAIADGTNVKIHMHTAVGDAAEEVVRLARKVNADMVLVETHDEKRLFHASVAAQIVQTAPCSVLTLRSPSHEGSSKK
jgi:nucleotide-binding universal stress UspA family protein